jgi:peptide/nickel transport system substrate-binding protein
MVAMMKVTVPADGKPMSKDRAPHPIFSDIRVRKAIACYGMDRKEIVKIAYKGAATPWAGIIPPGTMDTVDVNHACPYDPAKAKALLAEAGHPDGFETSMTIASSFPAQMAMAPIIQANLAAVGIKAKIGTMEIPRYWDEVWSTSNFDITSMYWLSPLADPDDFLTNNYKCGMAINVQKYCNNQMDDLLEQAKAAATEAERKELYKQVTQLSLDDMGQVPLVNGWLLIAHTNKLQNYKPMRTGFLKTLKDAWFEG